MIEPLFNNFDNDLIEIRSDKHRTILPFLLPFPLTDVEYFEEGDLPIKRSLQVLKSVTLK